jgi:hypothetical protein
VPPKRQRPPHRTGSKPGRKSDAPRSAGAAGSRRHATLVQARQAPGGAGWELIHPRCALDRVDDLEEVHKMIDAGEIDVARDELQWLLGGCTDMIDAHKTLGELALLDRDLPLARGHFGYAYQVGVKALDRAGAVTGVPYSLPGNQAFFEAGKGLAYCLRELGKTAMAAEVVARLLACDPGDPLGVRSLGPPG